MGNHHSHHHHHNFKEKVDTADGDHVDSHKRGSGLFHHQHSQKYRPCLEKLFQKLELTADEDNRHPGELSRATFEDAFHGPLHMFGELLFIEMAQINHHGNHHHDNNAERITMEQFVKAGKTILKLYEESDQLKYYFHLFSQRKDSISKEDALHMVDVCYALTLSASNIAYTKRTEDDNVFAAIVESMFGVKELLSYQEFQKWTHQHLPHIFCGVHSWVNTILTGSKLPLEQETAPVPQLEKFVADKHCISMGMLWALSAVLPPSYTHTDEKDMPEEGAVSKSHSHAVKNPLLNSYNLIKKMVRLSKCQSWNILYDSNEHGLSRNRFTHHVTSYQGPTMTLVSFEGRNVYCIAQDSPWRYGTQRFGGEDTMLLQIKPVFRVIQAGGPLVLWNEHSRDLRKGIHIGKDKALVLFIPADFDQVEHYRVPCEFHKLEVWGCGGSKALTRQVEQKQWECKEVEKHSARKLHLDTNWDENPDKQILQWGGITVEHQYTRDSGF